MTRKGLLIDFAGVVALLSGGAALTQAQNSPVAVDPHRERLIRDLDDAIRHQDNDPNHDYLYWCLWQQRVKEGR